MKKLLAVAMMAGWISGCESMHQSVPSASLNPGVKAKLHANIEVGEKIQGASTAYVVLGFFTFGDTQYADGVDYGVSGFSGFLDAYGSAKSAAAYKATVLNNVDVIVAPRYVIEEQNYLLFKRIDVVVDGYRGTIQTIH